MNEVSDKSSLGTVGEDLTCKYLKSQRFEILGRNIREKFGEIDVLAKGLDGTLHFVEVKTISAGYAAISGMAPEDNLSRAKLGKMKKIAEWYANAHPELVGKGGWQMDLVAVSVSDDGKSEINFYPNLI